MDRMDSLCQAEALTNGIIQSRNLIPISQILSYCHINLQIIRTFEEAAILLLFQYIEFVQSFEWVPFIKKKYNINIFLYGFNHGYMLEENVSKSYKL